MLLLIPGPVTTHDAVRAAAAIDYAPWDNEFRQLVARLRERVLVLAGGTADHTALILQGCGHFAMEAAFATFVRANGRILVPKTGQYADRLERLATEIGRTVLPMCVPDGQRVDPVSLDAALAADPTISHVALVYSETATGIIHDVTSMSQIAGSHDRRVIVDAVSAFGALPFDIGALPMVDTVTFTTNKCIEGLPGASFTIARKDRLAVSTGNARSWSFDLSDVSAHYERAPGAHRFTPAAGALASFDVALDQFDAEGGQPARLARYTENMLTLRSGVERLGLSPSIPLAVQGPIVLNVDAPADPRWDLQVFVDSLKSRGFIISNFYNTIQPSFRLGCIGAIEPEDMRRAVGAIESALEEMGVRHRAPRAWEAA
ncbi:MAG: 2-aminoethylphosphonate--pyruvate transaminase [Pseudomonadota bacterium]|nr:2-aminoethylphosphonate--pyruvate transaminase [Pseudomonadota bacterium]